MLLNIYFNVLSILLFYLSILSITIFLADKQVHS